MDVDLGILHCEITQGLQLHDNSLPLVAGKPTVVRVIPTVLGEEVVNSVNATLSEVADGCAGASITASNGPINVHRRLSRHDTEHSLDFLLEPDWCSGERTFLVTLDLPAGVNDVNVANNSIEIRAKFHQRDPIRLRYVIISHDQQEPSARVREMRTVGLLRSVLPIDPLDLSYEQAVRPHRVFNEKVNGRIDDAKLIMELNKIFLRDSLAEKLYGWTASGVFPYNGRSDPIYAGGQGYVAFGNDDGDDSHPGTWRWRRTLVHEFGHNLSATDLHHPSKHPESSYFYSHRLKADQFGYDVLGIDPYRRVVMRRSALDPQRMLFDCMVPARLECEAWIGRRNYLRLFKGTAVSVTDSWTEGGNQDANLYYIFHGVIRQNHEGELVRPDPFNPLLLNPKIFTFAEMTPRGLGDAEIRFFDGGGEIRERRIGWTPRFEDAEGNPADSWFSWVDQLPDECRLVQLYYDGEMISEAEIRGPSFGQGLSIENEEAVIDPTEQKLKVAWNTVGHVPNKTFYSVSYGVGDSGTGQWSEIADGEQDQNPMSVEIPVANLPGPHDGNVSILVEREGDIAISTTLTVGGPPQEPNANTKVEIISPESVPAAGNGPGPRTYRENEHLLLIGYLARFRVRDANANLSWHLVEGEQATEIGQGEKTVFRDGLSAGDYIVRLTANDTGDTAEVAIRVIN